MRKLLHLALIAAPLAAHAGDSQPVSLSAYGFVKAGGVYSTGAMDSFGNQNLSAPTAASPAGTSHASDDRRSFQVGQSRFGFLIRPGDQATESKPRLSGQFEFDLIDFTKASPTTTSVPRVRVAKVSYRAGDHDLFELGQDWDVFSPGKPFTWGFVGLYFNAGNVGFMRQQAKWAHEFDGGLTVTGALGMPGVNKTAADSDVERSLLPSGSLQVSQKLGEKGVGGLSGIVGPAYFTSGANTIKHSYYGVNAFYSLTRPDALSLSCEAYYGQNLGNSGALSLASGEAHQTLHEAGGYVSAQAPIAGPLSMLGGVGYAQVFEAVGDGTGSSIPAERRRSNGKVELGASVDLADHVKVFAQETVFRTKYTTGIQTNAVSELGLYLNF